MTEPKVALFPGSFDPFTKGHEDIVKRGLQLFDKVVICIGHNSQKKRYFDIDLMIEKIKEAFDNSGAIEVVTYNDLTATLARNYNAKYLLRKS
jgi:pantetheine-phosphate adenylyltransferase